jgi:hypothetical protein
MQCIQLLGESLLHDWVVTRALFPWHPVHTHRVAEAAAPSSSGAATAAAPCHTQPQNQPRCPVQSQQQLIDAAGCTPFCHRAHPCIPPLSSECFSVPSSDVASTVSWSKQEEGNSQHGASVHSPHTTQPPVPRPSYGPHRQANIASWWYAVSDCMQDDSAGLGPSLWCC